MLLVARQATSTFSKSFPWPALGQLIHQFIQVTDVPHERVLDFLHTDAAYLAGNEGSVRVHGRGIAEKVTVAGLGLFQPGKVRRGIAGEPGGHLVHLLPGAAFLFRLGNIHKYARPEDRPEHTLFVITTDGMENASHRYSAPQVREMICRQKEKYGWEFLFLGANIDAVETAGSLGIDPDRAVNYHCDSAGTRLNYQVVSQAVAAVRCSAPLDKHWKDAIEEDFRKRR